MAGTNYKCQTEKIAAYIDGDLDRFECSALEAHLLGCRTCAEELRAQRLFVCELDAMLASPSNHPVPGNFAQIVAIRAESDMRGVRDRAEHKRALRFSAMLAFASFALLGVAANKSIVPSAWGIIAGGFGVVAFFWKVLYDAVVGLVVISRVVSRGILPESHLVALLAFLLLALAVALLSLLISSYHRYRRARLVE